MNDLDKIIKNMTDEVTAAVVESCAKCAEIYLKTPESREESNGYVKGYNDAVREIARSIRELK